MNLLSAVCRAQVHKTKKMLSVPFRDTCMHSVLSISILENIQYWFQYFSFASQGPQQFFISTRVLYSTRYQFVSVFFCLSFIIIHIRSLIVLILCLHANIINHNRSFIAGHCLLSKYTVFTIFPFFYLKYIFLWHGFMATYIQSCGSVTFLYGSGSRIHTTNLLIRIQLRILLFCHWRPRCQQKIFFSSFFAYQNSRNQSFSYFFAC